METRGPKKTNPKLAKIIAKNIRTLRIKRGMTQSHLAREAGFLSSSAITQIESTRAMPSLTKLYDLSAALGVTVRKILP